MALVTVTFEDVSDDQGDGVKVLMKSDPPFPGPAASDQQLTNAQHAAMTCIHMMSHQEQHDCQDHCSNDCGCKDKE